MAKKVDQTTINSVTLAVSRHAKPITQDEIN